MTGTLQRIHAVGSQHFPLRPRSRAQRALRNAHSHLEDPTCSRRIIDETLLQYDLPVFVLVECPDDNQTGQIHTVVVATGPNDPRPARTSTGEPRIYDQHLHPVDDHLTRLPARSPRPNTAPSGPHRTYGHTPDYYRA
jgi:hypothetical protein